MAPRQLLHCFRASKYLRRHLTTAELPAGTPITEQLVKLDHGDLHEDLSRYRSILYENILGRGHVLVRGLPVEHHFVKRFIEEVLDVPLQRTIYGEVFDVVSTTNPINIAYSNVELKPHMDLVYYESPPGLQLLLCLKFDKSVVGGDSFLIDAIRAAEDLRARDERSFDALRKIPATFQKIHFERQWPVYMRYCRPHINVNHQNQVTGVFWAPPFEGPLMFPEYTEEYTAAYRQFARLIKEDHRKLTFRLAPGDMIIFNNRRLLHGRTAFTSNGERHLQGAYVNIDEALSRGIVESIRQGNTPKLPRTGNQNMLFDEEIEEKKT